METKFWGLGFPFSSTVSFGEIPNSARRRNSNSKFKTLSRANYTIFVLWWLCNAGRDAPSASDSGISARATSAQMPMSGQTKSRTAQIPGNEPFTKLPALLRERKFPLPGSGSPPTGGVCPRHPHSTFFNIVFSVSLSLSISGFQFGSGTRPLVVDTLAEMPEA